MGLRRSISSAKFKCLTDTFFFLFLDAFYVTFKIFGLLKNFPLFLNHVLYLRHKFTLKSFATIRCTRD